MTTAEFTDLPSVIPTYICNEVINYELRENMTERFPSLAWECVKMFRDDVFIIDKASRRPMYAVNLKSGSLKAVHTNAMKHEERARLYFNVWMENTEYVLLKEFRTLRAKFTDLQ